MSKMIVQISKNLLQGLLLLGLLRTNSLSSFVEGSTIGTGMIPVKTKMIEGIINQCFMVRNKRNRKSKLCFVVNDRQLQHHCLSNAVMSRVAAKEVLAFKRSSVGFKQKQFQLNESELKKTVRKDATSMMTMQRTSVNCSNMSGEMTRRQFALASPVVAAAATVFVADARLTSLQHYQSSKVANAAVPRAVGSGELKCRAENNCLQVGEWDGAVGWEWGGKDRCDASDPQCGPNGQVRTITGKPVPVLPSANTSQESGTVVISHVVIFQVAVGRGDNEVGTIRLGLYGNECPESVSQFLDFVSASSTGLTTLSKEQVNNGMGSITSPVSLARGGIITSIVPQLSVEFGVPSQSNAYARSRGITKLSNVAAFLPQPRPSPTLTANDLYVREHDCAGLLSLPSQGIGYGGTGFESDDEAFEAAFILTDDAVPAFDQIVDKAQQRRRRRVIGQILDPASMAFLERLSNIPTKRGIRGVIPGQTSGPPLLKTSVREIQDAKVTPPPN